MGERMRLDLYDGKYTYILYEDGRQVCLRYGEEWRDLCGDNLIRAMAHEIESLKEIVTLSPAKVVESPCTVCRSERNGGTYKNMPLCLDCYKNRADDVKEAYEKWAEKACLCQGFYKPRHCPVHGDKP